MSDFAQFPRPVKGCRAEYGSGKTRLIVDACQLSDDLYEVITMRPRASSVLRRPAADNRRLIAD